MPHWSEARAAASLQLMIRVAAECGVSRTRCIAGTGLTYDELVDPVREVEGRQELAVLRNILRALGPHVPFGLMAGLRYHSTTHGMWGFTVMSSPDLVSAIETALRFFDLSYSFNRVRFDPERARLIYDGSDNPDDLRAALIERDLGALLSLERDNLGYTLPASALELCAPRASYAAEFERLFQVVPRFGAEQNWVAARRLDLATPQPMADELGVRMGEEQCRRLLEQRTIHAGFAARVRSQILGKPGEFPRMEQVAAELGMSTRTLRNRLQRESTSYRALVESAREALAEELLLSELTLDAIAERLGYGDTSSFIAAFKRWKGVAPGTYKARPRA